MFPIGLRSLPLVAALATLTSSIRAGESASDWALPPGWLGVHAGMAMAVKESAGVHVGDGWVLTSARSVAGYAVGWNVDLFTADRAREPVRFRRAKLVRLDETEDLALLRLDRADGVSTAAVCEHAPHPDEKASTYSISREGKLASQIDVERIDFVATRPVPDRAAGAPGAGLAGKSRHAFFGVASPGQHGGGAYSSGSACLHGIVSFVDAAVPADRSITWVVPVEVVQAWLDKGAEAVRLR